MEFNDSLESHAQPELNLTLAIEGGRVAAKRLPKRGGVCLQAGEISESGKRAIHAARRDGIAESLHLSYVAVIEEVE